MVFNFCNLNSTIFNQAMTFSVDFFDIWRNMHDIQSGIGRCHLQCARNFETERDFVLIGFRFRILPCFYVYESNILVIFRLISRSLLRDVSQILVRVTLMSNRQLIIEST